MAHALVSEQGTPDADLDIVGMSADGEHYLAVHEPGSPPSLDELVRRGDQPFRLQRLLQELVGAMPQRRDRVVDGHMRRDDGDRDGRRHLTQCLEQLEPGHARHLHVGDDQVPALGTGLHQCGRRVGGMADVEAAPLAQDVHGELGRFRIVLDNKDPARRCCLVVAGHRPTFRCAGCNGVRVR